MADVVVLDTDVVSFLFKNHPHSELYRSHVENVDYRVISFMTVAELERWSLVRNWGQTRRDALYSEIRKYTIHYVQRELCAVWAQATESARLNGHPIDPADAWIAATALFQKAPLITHNRRHFEGVDDLEVISSGDR